MLAAGVDTTKSTRAARRRNISAPDASGKADRLASAQGARSTQAVQIANIAARLELLSLTSYQRGIFAIIATAWFFDSMDRRADLRARVDQADVPALDRGGLLSSLSFLGMAQPQPAFSRTASVE